LTQISITLSNTQVHAVQLWGLSPRVSRSDRLTAPLLSSAHKESEAMAESLPIRLVEGPRGDWTALASRPHGWKVRRITAGPRCRYLLHDPAKLDVVIWLSAVPLTLVAAMREVGYRPYPDDERVWVRPSPRQDVQAA
jgi:hypothetical protein